MAHDFDVPRCELCGAELPPRARTGRRRRFCSKRCANAASRLRREAIAAGEIASPGDDEAPVEAYLVGRAAARPDEQVAAAVHESILLVVTFRRLAVESRRQFAWRCAGMSKAIDEALARYFKVSS